MKRHKHHTHRGKLTQRYEPPLTHTTHPCKNSLHNSCHPLPTAHLQDTEYVWQTGALGANRSQQDKHMVSWGVGQHLKVVGGVLKHAPELKESLSKPFPSSTDET